MPTHGPHLFLLLFAWAGGAHGAGPDSRDEVVFWNIFTAGGPARAITELVDRYNGTSPRYRVRKLDVPDVGQKLLTAIAGRVPPDVSLFNRFTVPGFAARRAFSCLDARIARDGVRPGDFFKACWEGSQFEGHVYAMPFNTDVRVLFYNNALFREAGLDPARPPRTWKELEAYSRKLTKRNPDGSFARVGFVPVWGNTYMYLYGWQKGGEFVSPDGRTVTCDDPRIVEALEWVSAYTNRYGLRDLLDLQAGFGAKENYSFFTGKVAMVGQEGFIVSLAKQYAPDLDYSVAPLPWPEDGVHATWSGGFALVLPSGARNPDGAWDFMKFMTAPEAQLTYAKTAEQLPANRLVTGDPYFSEDPKWRVFVAEMKHSRFLPVSVVSEQLWEGLIRATDQVVWGKASAGEALAECRRRSQKALDDYHAKALLPPLNWSRAVGIVLLVALTALAAKLVHSVRRIRRSRLHRREQVWAYVFVAPWLVGFALFAAGPMVASLLYSFSSYEVLTPARWAGLANYRTMLTGDPLFWRSLWNTVFYTMFAVPLGVVAGLALAVLLNQKVRFVAAWRTVFFLPSIVPAVAASVVWLWIFNPQFGLLNWGLRQFGIAGPAWLADESWAKPSLVLMSLWGVGGGMVIYLAALQGVPQVLFDAARIDGAGPWQRFRHVTLPMLSPAIFFNLIIGTIASFQVFTQAYIMTGGGPVDSTLFYVLYLFRNAFAYFNMGYASAMAWILFAVILVLTAFHFLLAKRWVYYEGGVR